MFCCLQTSPQRAVAGVLPHAAQRAGLRLAAQSGEPPLQAGVHPAAELRQQTGHAQEPPGGSAAGESQGGPAMTARWTAAWMSHHGCILKTEPVHKKICKYI